MLKLTPDDPIAIALFQAIQAGDLPALNEMLVANRELATAGINDGKLTRSLLHVATDWPGHFPNNVATVKVLIEAGADVNATCNGRHAETPLHWAASCDDVDVIDALLDAGADIEAPGAVLGGGTALWDAVGFGQWKAALRLVERGASTTMRHAAALGLMERVEANFAGREQPSLEDVTAAFWHACHGGQLQVARFLLERGADVNWVGYGRDTALDIARKAEAPPELIEWLLARGAKPAAEVTERS